MAMPSTSKNISEIENDDDFSFLSEESDVEMLEDDLEEIDGDRIYEEVELETSDASSGPNPNSEHDKWSENPPRNIQKLHFEKIQEAVPTIKLNPYDAFSCILTDEIVDK